jgi:SNF2 family DNA or RNA helicase
MLKALPAEIISQTQPWKHQSEAFRFAYLRQGAMLAMDMGTGKSKVVVDLVVNRCHRRVLIICPKSVVQVWPKQVALHAGAVVTVVTLDTGSVKEKMAQAQKILLNAKSPVVIVINYESVWREPFGEWTKQKANFDLLVMDESHRIKAPGGRASRFCSNLADRIPYRLALTGTPMPQNPLDIYAQFRALNKGVFGSSYANFTARYAELDEFHRLKRIKAPAELNRKFYSLAYRVKASDVLDLPEKIHETRTFQLSARARRVYDELEKEFTAWVEAGREITTTNALTRLLRLQQITSGFVVDDARTITEIDVGKRDLLIDILEDLDPNEPVVIFARFQKDLDTVHRAGKELGRKSLELSGRVNQLAAWQGGKAPVLAVQTQAGGVGIDLTRSRYTIYYSLGYSLGDYEQSVARTHRPGQSRSTVFYHLLAEKTKDLEVMWALEHKKNVVETILKRGGMETIATGQRIFATNLAKA